MDFVRTELHCHNKFSNFQLGLKETPYDCGISIEEQIEQAYRAGLGAFFITNHNTLDGYESLLEHKANHEKYRHIQIYPGEEITKDKGIPFL